MVKPKNYFVSQPNIIDLEPEEIWVIKEPSKADHIRVCRGLYSHHGIYVSDEEVIHFTGSEDDSVLDWSKPEVISSDIDYFLKGGVLEVKEYTDDELEDLYSVEHIVNYARACLGDKGYNLVFNNCEHFANTCTLGRFRSRQVEAVFNAVFGKKSDIVVYGGNNMSIFGSVGRFFKGLFGKSSGGSRSTSNTNYNYNYEPDKVKIAEIEAENRIKLAEMEKERIDLIKNSQIELLQFNTDCMIAIEEAKARNLNNMANVIMNLQTELNEMAVKRLEIIEKASIPIIKEIETVYSEFAKQIESDNDDYSLEKLPKLLNLLEQYEEGSTAHKLYQKRIEDDMVCQAEHYNLQIKQLAKRQDAVINSAIENRKFILEQTNSITEGILQSIQKQIELQFENAQIYNQQDRLLKLSNGDSKDEVKKLT